MNVGYSTWLDKSNLSALLSDERFAGARSRLEELWTKFDFAKAQRNVSRLQARIVKAFQKGQTNKVKVLQGLLVRSLSARMLAVLRVTSSKGARTTGIDGQRWSTPASKMAGALSLRKRGYKASPLRRVQIPKAGSNKRRALGIPTIYDRALQALYLQGLDPIAEVRADPNSYGFRRFRSTHDAIEQAFNLLCRKNSANWILDADIRGCFDHISHPWMIENVPMDQSILSQWLKCGFVDMKGKLFPTTAGTPQGGIVSPCLCNWVLDELERVVTTAVKSGRQIHFVRYADDFIVTARHRSDLEDSILPAIKDWLGARGLILSEEKTRIRHIRQGFDFLGQNLRKFPDGKLRITPSSKNVQTFLAKARQCIRGCLGENLATVISRLNPKIRGWANYHRYGVALERYAYVDHQIHQAITGFLRRSHPGKSMTWISRRYVQKDPAQSGRQTYAVTETLVDEEGKPFKKTWSLKLAGLTPRRWFLKVRQGANPYDPQDRPYYQRLRVLRRLIKAGKWKPKWKAG